MRRGTLAVAALTLLLVTSGCNAVLQDRTTTVTREEYDVPAEPNVSTTPTTTVPPNETDVAPGLASHGIRDAFAIAEAHANRLAGDSYRVRHNYTVRYPNGTVVRQRGVDASVGVRAGEFRVYRSELEDGRRVEERFYSGGDLSPVYGARTAEESTDYWIREDDDDRSIDLRDVLFQDPTYKSRLYSLLSAVESARVSPDDTTDPESYVVRATGYEDRYLISGMGNAPARNVTMVAFVAESGVVEGLFVRYRTEVDGRTVVVEEGFRFEGVGSTDVEAPAWVDEARAAESDETSGGADGDDGGGGNENGDGDGG